MRLPDHARSADGGRRRLLRTAIPAVALLFFAAAAGPASTRLAPFRPLQATTDIARASLNCSTYFGGSGEEQINDVSVDSAGNIYLTGTTTSANFPVHEALQPAIHGNRDAFVVKLGPDGRTVLFSTYLGGSREETGFGIEVDAAGSIFVAGSTYSDDFPVVDPLATDPGDDSDDAFLVKLSPDGQTLLYATYLGGAFSDFATALAVDGAGAVYLTGRTRSTDFPTTAGVVQPAPAEGACDSGACRNVFVTKVAPGGQSLDFSTYLTGTGSEEPNDIAIDSAGHAFVTGWTNSADFPTRSAAQPANGGGNCGTVSTPRVCEDVFLTKLAADGSAFEYSTFLGGTRNDRGYEVEVAADGTAYLAGWAGSADFPLVNPIQAQFGGLDSDAIVCAIAPDGGHVVFSTFLGGGNLDDAYGLALTPAGEIVVTGISHSSNFPVRNAFDATFGQIDGWVAKLAPGGAPLVYASYLGGSQPDVGIDVARSEAASGMVFVGITLSTDFPVVGAVQASNGGGIDGFLTMIPDAGAAPVISSVKASPAGKPFKLTLRGTNFQVGLAVFIGDDTAAWGSVVVKNDAVVLLKGGNQLKAKFPKRVAVPIRLVNPDGGEATGEFTR